jgi:hypothetical protein
MKNLTVYSASTTVLPGSLQTIPAVATNDTVYFALPQDIADHTVQGAITGALHALGARSATVTSEGMLEGLYAKASDYMGSPELQALELLGHALPVSGAAAEMKEAMTTIYRALPKGAWCEAGVAALIRTQPARMAGELMAVYGFTNTVVDQALPPRLSDMVALYIRSAIALHRYGLVMRPFRVLDHHIADRAVRRGVLCLTAHRFGPLCLPGITVGDDVPLNPIFHNHAEFRNLLAYQFAPLVTEAQRQGVLLNGIHTDEDGQAAINALLSDFHSVRF